MNYLDKHVPIPPSQILYDNGLPVDQYYWIRMGSYIDHALRSDGDVTVVDNDVNLNGSGEYTFNGVPIGTGGGGNIPIPDPAIFQNVIVNILCQVEQLLSTNLDIAGNLTVQGHTTINGNLEISGKCDVFSPGGYFVNGQPLTASETPKPLGVMTAGAYSVPLTVGSYVTLEPTINSTLSLDFDGSVPNSLTYTGATPCSFRVNALVVVGQFSYVNLLTIGIFAGAMLIEEFQTVIKNNLNVTQTRDKAINITWVITSTQMALGSISIAMKTDTQNDTCEIRDILFSIEGLNFD